MVNMTLSVPENLYKKLKERSEINWSDVARHAFEDYLAKLEITDKIASASQLTENDVMELGELIKERVWERHRKKA